MRDRFSFALQPFLRALSRLWTVLTCATTLALSACAPSLQGAPPRVFSVATETAELQRLAGPEQYVVYHEADPTMKRAVRDRIIFARMYAIDIAYSQYELRLTREHQSVGFLGTLGQLSISTAGVVLDGEQVKTILHAAEGGLTGLKEGYDKNILVDRTIDALQKTMRANRQTVKAKIIERTDFDTTRYPLELALSDLEEYYRAGTITGALIGISQEAGVALQIADAQEQEVLTYKFNRTEYLSRLRTFYRASEKNRQCMRDWLAQPGRPEMDVTSFMGAGRAADQAEMIAACNIP